MALRGEREGRTAGRGPVVRQRGRSRPRREWITAASAAEASTAQRRARRRVSTGWIVRIAVKVVDLTLLIGSLGLLYYLGTSGDYRVTTVRVGGQALANAAEIEDAAGARGQSVFQIDRRVIAERVRRVPAVADADVEVVAPHHVVIQVTERVPIALWRSGSQAVQVDADGVVLSARPPVGSLLTIIDADGQPVAPGERVNVDALRAAGELRRLLPARAGIAPAEFEYSRETGISVTTEQGLVIRFGSSEDLEGKISALLVVRAHLEETGTRATLIDLRFRDRPYYR